MKKVIILCVTIFVIVASGIYLYFQEIYKPLHQSISKEDVSDIQVYGASTKTTTINDTVLKENLIKWFNNAADIRLNKNFEGTTSESGIIINLKLGKRILILRPGKDFEIQRDDVRLKNISYWAKQQELKEYLDKLAINTDGLSSTIDDKLNTIIQNPKAMFSSNPYDYVKDSRDYEWIVKQGVEVLEYMLQKFEKSKENGLREYIMAIACSEILGDRPENKKWSSGREWYENYLKDKKQENINIKGSLVDVYSKALDSFMPLDEGLNGDMKFIAIEGSTLKYLQADKRNEVLKNFEKYKVKVMIASLDELKKMGLFNEKQLYLEGLLLSVKDVTIVSDEEIVVEGSKYRSGDGAIGVKCTLKYKNGNWKVDKADITWIS